MWDITKEHKFQWRSQTEHIMFFVTYLMDWSLFSSLLYETRKLNPDKEPTLVHFLVVIIVLGSPVLFFQTFVGEYTGRGCIFIGEMIPVAYGLGYSMLLISFVRFTYSLFYTTKVLEFLLAVIVSSKPPWMRCSQIFRKQYPGCFQKEDLDMCPTRLVTDEPCFKPKTKQLATYLYKEYSVFLRNEPVTKSLYFTKVLYHSFHIIIILALLLIFALKGIRSFSESLRVCIIFCLGALFSIFIVVATKPGSGLGFYAMFLQINMASLTDLKTWRVTVRRVIQGLRLAEGGHFLFGSFIPETASSHQRFVHLIIVFGVMIFSTFLYFYFFEGLLLFRLSLNVKDLDLESEENTVFITYPLVLGVQASSYFFCTLNFLMYFFLSFHALVLKVFVLEKTISVQFDIQEYSHYLQVAIIMSATMLTFALELLPFYKRIEVIDIEFKYYHICTLALQMLVLLMYGLQRINDDVSFYTHSQVKRFTQFGWIAAMIFCIASFYLELKDDPPVNLIIRLIICAVFCLPFVLFFFIKTFSYIRKKNIIGLLRPSDLFGPRDVEKRVLRILYNPRLALKCKGREEICYHNCLSNSSTIETAVQEEILLIRKFIADLQKNPLDLELSTNIIAELGIYEDVLLKKLNEKASLS